MTIQTLSIDPETKEVICSCGNRTSDYDHEGFLTWDDKGQVAEEESDISWIECLECDTRTAFSEFRKRFPDFKW